MRHAPRDMTYCTKCETEGEQIQTQYFTHRLCHNPDCPVILYPDGET